MNGWSFHSPRQMIGHGLHSTSLARLNYGIAMGLSPEQALLCNPASINALH
jgi:hypothetical protein